MRAARLAAVTSVAMLGCLAAVVAPDGLWSPEGNRCARQAPAIPGKPNIVLIVTDDQRKADAALMPRLSALVADEGLTFSNFFVTLSLCCPSRATILLGRYARNHGVLGNDPPQGGWPVFFDRGHERSTVAVWLQDAGYRTALIGKYLNAYPGNAPTHVPQGWDEWYGDVGVSGYYNYRLNENGRLITYGTNPQEYHTDVTRRLATRFICSAATIGRPFFLYVAPFAPHEAATPAVRHLGMFDGARVPRSPSFNESDVSDKLPSVRSLPLLSSEDVAEVDQLYRRRLEALQAVDELVSGVIAALESAGLLDNTFVFFTSDNGFHLGEHRIKTGKSTVFEETIRVPLMVRGPGVARGRVVQQLAVNADLAPTFADLGGAAMPSFIDGRSLRPLLSPDGPAGSWRKAFLVEVFGTGAVGAALRTERYVFHRVGPDLELYDLEKDPFQLTSTAQAVDSSLVVDLAAWFKRVASCSGVACKMAEDSVF